MVEQLHGPMLAAGPKIEFTVQPASPEHADLNGQLTEHEGQHNGQASVHAGAHLGQCELSPNLKRKHVFAIVTWYAAKIMFLGCSLLPCQKFNF